MHWWQDCIKCVLFLYGLECELWAGVSGVGQSIKVLDHVGYSSITVSKTKRNLEYRETSSFVRLSP